MRKPAIGLLPLYIELYDNVLPALRERMERFLRTLAGELEARGLDVLAAPVCRVRPEFEDALGRFGQAGADAVVTVHLAYSPSLESAEALARTKLPVIVLDTTETWDFHPGVPAEEIIYNHGIHGVQDMCNLLRRNGKAFEIAAGHWEQSDVLDRVAALARSARAASAFRGARVGVVGGAFAGMGDFAVPDAELREAAGVETVHLGCGEAERLLALVTERQIDAETALDRSLFDVRLKDEAAWRLATKAGLALREWAGAEALTAFSVNFLAMGNGSPIPVMPFLEASKAMARGLGYAGEGDALTAALTGALASAFPEVSFAEMFCPDWRGGRVFLSHMGEMNLNLVKGRPLLLDTPSAFVGTGVAVAAYGRFKPGRASVVNLAPGRDGFTLVVIDGEMLDHEGTEGMAQSVRGWFRPGRGLAECLEDYSRAGGTHHSALVYGDCARTAAGFGRMMGWKVVEL